VSAVSVVPSGQIWVVLSRALIFAIFVILLALAGEAVLVTLLNLGGHAWFTTLWAFFMASATLAFFPTTYLGEPLGFGLSRLSKSQDSVAMTRSIRFAIFLFYLCLVTALGFVTEYIEHIRGVTQMDARVAFPLVYVMISAIMAIYNRRYL